MYSWDSGRFQLTFTVREQQADLQDSFVINGGLTLQFLEQHKCEKKDFFTFNVLIFVVKFLTS